ncbi:MAG: glycosyl transferase family protein [Magnetospirillum sp.]|nr:MAG: glycosyl transferase family protein [Magnetospirillum sp.]
MTQEHPFAQYVRILGKGPNLSRPLTFDEAKAAMAMVMAGEVLPVQLGAFLCLLRVRTESPEEVAGMAAAIRQSILVPNGMPPIDLDWASYAGKSRQLPFYVLAALALAGAGIRVFMHGAEHHTAGRVYTSEALAALGVPVAADVADAARRLAASGFAYMTLERLSPPLQRIMDLKPLLGLRSPIHTVARVVNPMRAACPVNAVTHPPYLHVHQEAARLLGETRMAAFKGEGGEFERRPEKECEVWLLEGGNPSREDWPALVDGAREKEETLDLARLKPLWAGDDADETAQAAITGTMAVALRGLGRAGSPAEAEALALSLWRGRARTRIPGAG